MGSSAREAHVPPEGDRPQQEADDVHDRRRHLRRRIAGAHRPAPVHRRAARAPEPDVVLPEPAAATGRDPFRTSEGEPGGPVRVGGLLRQALCARARCAPPVIARARRLVERAHPSRRERARRQDRAAAA